MNPERIKGILANPKQLKDALADPELLPLLPVNGSTVAALPIQLAPFQARWLLGNCTDDVLRNFREVHPAIIVQRFGTGKGARYRYSKIAVCRAGAVPCEEFRR